MTEKYYWHSMYIFLPIARAAKSLGIVRRWRTEANNETPFIHVFVFVSVLALKACLAFFIFCTYVDFVLFRLLCFETGNWKFCKLKGGVNEFHSLIGGGIDRHAHFLLFFCR
jgi:hypothetical protein